MLTAPAPPPPPLQRRLDQHFDDEEQLELAFGLGLFHGFSKMLIVLGLEPEDMDTTILPTPAPRGDDVQAGDLSDPHVQLLATMPDLAARWSHMADQLSALVGSQAAALDIARARVAQLLGIEWAATRLVESRDSELEALVSELAELFMLDVRAVTPDLRMRVAAHVGQSTMVPLIMSLAVYDGIYRLAAVRTGREVA